MWGQVHEAHRQRFRQLVSTSTKPETSLAAYEREYAAQLRSVEEALTEATTPSLLSTVYALLQILRPLYEPLATACGPLLRPPCGSQTRDVALGVRARVRSPAEISRGGAHRGTPRTPRTPLSTNFSTPVQLFTGFTTPFRPPFDSLSTPYCDPYVNVYI